jgi:hypothetical protein
MNSTSDSIDEAVEPGMICYGMGLYSVKEDKCGRFQW